MFNLGIYINIKQLIYIEENIFFYYYSCAMLMGLEQYILKTRGICT